MQNNIKTPFWIIAGVICMFLVVACSGEYIYRKDVEQLSKPGALDLPLTGFYTHYQYKLLDRYKVTHQWIRESNCDYRKVESKKYDGKDRFFNVRDIFEEGGSTWQRFDAKTGNFNFDQYVRAEYLSGPNGNGVTRVEKGFSPLCFQSWWNTSNYIRLRLQKRPLNELIKAFNERYPEGTWTTKTVNNQTWRVQEIPESKFRTRPLNGVGGPFQSWITTIGDSGYMLAIELGASKESLQYPDAHARMQAMFMHLIESVKIEPLQIGSANITPVKTELAKPAPPIKPTTSETKQLLPKNNRSTTIPMREYPDKPTQLQQNMQRDSSSDMKNLLRNTAPKMGR